MSDLRPLEARFVALEPDITSGNRKGSMQSGRKMFGTPNVRGAVQLSRDDRVCRLHK